MKQLRFIAALLAAFFVLSLTACGSGSNSFTWFVDSIPANLDPQVASSASDIIACENLYSGLVRRTPDGSLAPELCERWEVSADRLTYTFYLKDGLTYTASKGDPTDYAITAETSSSRSSGCSSPAPTPPTPWSSLPSRTAPPFWPVRSPPARWASPLRSR